MLIAVTGAKSSGKDTFAKLFLEKGFRHEKFAEPLKNMIRSLYTDAGLDLTEIEKRIEGPLKEKPCEILNGATPRYAMQTVGTEWAKMVDPTHTIWSNLFHARVGDLLKTGWPVICTDLRFLHEFEVIQSLGGYVVRVERPGHLLDDQHPSETEMLKLTPDEVVLNMGSIFDLRVKSKEVLRDITR